MKKGVVHKWIPLPSSAISSQPRSVTIREDGRRGIVWDGVPLAVQMARDAIAVVFGDDKAAQYFRKDEIEFVKRV